MKKHELLFSVSKVPLDFFVIVCAFLLAREFRLISDFTPGIAWFKLPFQTISLTHLYPFAFFGWALFVVLMGIHWLYNIKLTASKLKEFLDIILYSFYWFIFYSVLIYLGKWIVYKWPELPRLIILYSFFFGTIFIIIERVILNWLQSLLLWLKVFDKRNILLINNLESLDIKHILQDIKKAGIYNITGYSNTQKVDVKLKYLWDIQDFERLLLDNKIDEILYIDSDFTKKELYNIWEISRIFGIRYRYITNSFDVTKSNTSLSLINSIPVIEIDNTPLDNWARVLKRGFDIIFGLMWSILILPLILIFWILIKLEDPTWPVIYRNRRIGQWGKIFLLYKFRYMKWEYCIKDGYGLDESKDTALKFEKKLIEERSKRNGPLYKISNDPRKTRIWKFLEKYSIDELPQFFNVLKWDMSIVGPRPHQPREVKNYDLLHKRLLTIKPWITGMAQVNGRENNDFNDEANLDIFYIENWSFLLDFKIILKTIITIISR